MNNSHKAFKTIKRLERAYTKDQIGAWTSDLPPTVKRPNSIQAGTYCLYSYTNVLEFSEKRIHVFQAHKPQTVGLRRDDDVNWATPDFTDEELENLLEQEAIVLI